MMRLRVYIAIVFSATLLPARTGAHTPGLSLADFEVHGDGEVDARLTFSMATAEPLTGTALDRDGDGMVTNDDLTMARDDLRAFVKDGVEVAADGSPCDGMFVGAALTEVDGLELRAAYACPAAPAEVQVTLYYLSRTTTGTPRRGVARIVAGSATAEGVLNGERRAISLRLPHADRHSPRLSSGLLLVPFAAIITAWLAWRSRRWRATRTTWQNRTP